MSRRRPDFDVGDNVVFIAFVLLMVLLALLACDGRTPVEPPPPPPPGPAPIVRVELVTDSALVFTGRALSARTFLAKAYDSTGAVVKDPVLTVSAPAGWTVRGDTLIAPATEARGVVRVTARRPSGVASGQRVAGLSLAGTASEAGATAALTVTAGADLRAAVWRVRFACGFLPGILMTDENRFVDSMAVLGATVDSVTYAGDASWIPNFAGVAQMWWSGPAVRYLAASREQAATVDTARWAGVAVVWSQAPDTLVFSGTDATGRAVRDTTAGAALRYTGGSWCRDEGWVVRRPPLVLEEVAPDA